LGGGGGGGGRVSGRAKKKYPTPNPRRSVPDARQGEGKK